MNMTAALTRRPLLKTATTLIGTAAFGQANLANRTPMSQDILFWLLSMTKAITATACMQLVEKGQISFEQPAGDILPEPRAPRALEGFDATGQTICVLLTSKS
jgi:CubicO group peptidase (beta-lactamase class C family)